MSLVYNQRGPDYTTENLICARNQGIFDEIFVDTYLDLDTETIYPTVNLTETF
jgi:hypothetical protein